MLYLYINEIKQFHSENSSKWEITLTPRPDTRQIQRREEKKEEEAGNWEAKGLPTLTLTWPKNNKIYNEFKF